MWSNLSPKLRRNLLRILPFGVIWFLFAQVFLISDYAASGSLTNVPETAIVVDWRIRLFANTLIVIVGLSVGAVELLYLNRRFASHSLRTKLIGKTAFYIVFLAVVILFAFPIAAALEMGTSVFDRRVLERLQGFMISKTSLSTVVQLAVSLVASLFYAEISEHMGPHVLRNFLTGRYHTPKAERRIFLFSDMKSSTTIAEQLGHEEYFELLRAYYDTLADAIVEHGGEVYQYIGDEIVVSWPEAVGARGGRCLACVLQMKRDLAAAGPQFEERFGVRPDFRAGLQLGPVTTGEIGALKKEIVFTGDVLNQTARIQALCSQQGVDVLVGDTLASRLTPSPRWTLRSLGEQTLRGKDRRVGLFALERVRAMAEQGPATA